MDVGDKVICQYDEWWNAFGEKQEVLSRGQRFIISETKNVGGTSFLAFEEGPKDNFYLFSGFTPMRNYN